MHALDRLERRIRGWTRAIAIIGLLGLLVISITTMADVLLRWIANAPLHGLNDINVLAVVIVVAACLPLVAAERQNITIKFLGGALGPRVTLWLDAFGSIVLLVYVAAIGWQLAVYTQELAQAGRTTWLLLLPVTPSWIVATVLVVLCVPIQAVVVAVDLVRAATGTPPPDRHGQDAGAGAAL